MKKYLFKKDSFFATIFVFAIIGALYYNPINSHLFNPFKVGLADFSINDLAFSKTHLSSTKDERIVIVNIDTIGRKSIANLLQHLKQYQPKVVGLDVLLPQKDDSANADLSAAIKAMPQIVLSQKIKPISDDEHNEKFELVDNQFVDKDHKIGYVNFRAEEGGVIRYFPPFLKNETKVYESFAVSVAQLANENAYQKIVKRNNVNEWINYKRVDSNYYIFNYTDILQDGFDSSFLKDKIVLLGFVSQDLNNIEDKHFTPLNKKLFGISFPDMSGVIIQANIISMILDKDYITRIPNWVMIIFAFFIIWIYMAFLLKYYIHKHIWFHIAAKSMELLLGILLVYIGVVVLRYFNIYIDFTLVIAATILAVDILYFYEGFRNWLQKKFNIHSIFNTH